MLAGEALALLAHGYRRYWIACLYCGDHGLWRVAVAFEPGQKHPCPVCGRERDCGVLPSLNFTRGELPRSTLLVGRIDMPALDRELAPEREPVRVSDNDHYVTAKGRRSRVEVWPYVRRTASQTP